MKSIRFAKTIAKWLILNHRILLQTFYKETIMRDEMNYSENSPTAKQNVKVIYLCLVALFALIVLFFAFLAAMIVPAPSSSNAFTVSGQVARITAPHPQHGDLTIILEDGRSYYVNRAHDVPYFAWEQLLDEVKPGDTIHLTVVKPLAWRLLTGTTPPNNGPVAGVWTDEVVYMNANIPAETWTAQTEMVRNFQIALLILALVMVVPVIFRKYGRFQPHSV